MSEQDRVVRVKEVVGLTGISRTSLSRLVAAGTFPKQVDIGMRANAWMLSDVQAWLAARQRVEVPASGEKAEA